MENSSLERIYPDTENDSQEKSAQSTLAIHLERYLYAAKNLFPGLIADIACGSGYGSFLLATDYSQHIEKIFAIDNNSEAISYARINYQHTLIDFQQMDAFNYTPPAMLNTIISLETIEHLKNPQKFVTKLSGFLVKGGRFIASAPVTPSMDANPYHLHDFTTLSFKKLFSSCGLIEVSSFIQVQTYHPFRLRKKIQDRSKEIRKGLFRFYLNHPGKFLLRIRSLFKDGFNNKYIVVVFEKK